MTIEVNNSPTYKRNESKEENVREGALIPMSFQHANILVVSCKGHRLIRTITSEKALISCHTPNLEYSINFLFIPFLLLV